MSDQAAVWKFAFGVLVLVFCAVAFVVRKGAPPVAAVPAAVSSQAVPAPVPLAPASAPPAMLEPAPADISDVQEMPVRIRISLHEAPVVKVHRATRHVARRIIHRKPHRASPSPYVAGRQHYPFDPRDRWQSRED
jgi:hypothetical protein